MNGQLHIPVDFSHLPPQNILHFVGYEVLRAVVMKGSIFWDIASCSLLKVNRRFRGTCCLHLQGQSISQARNQLENKWQVKHAGFFLGLFFNPKNGVDMFLQNVGLLSMDYRMLYPRR
jgi:hypothetical protein